MNHIEYLSLLLAFFLIYSFLGWCVEVAYHAVSFGKIVNRGFLNGPVCPIYGFGMLAVIVLLLPVEENLLLLFLGGMCLTSGIELFGGWLLDRLFHMRWWNYSDQPFNLGGYICLKFSLMWGIGCVLMVRVVHPLILTLLEMIPPIIGAWAMVFFYLLYALDTVATVHAVIGLGHDLENLDRVTRELREISDRMTECIADGAISTGQRMDEQRVQAALARAEARDAAEKIQNRARENMTQMKKRLAAASMEAERDSRYADLVCRKKELEAMLEESRNRMFGRRYYGVRHFLGAFPGMQHKDYRETLNELKEFVQKKRN